MRHLFTVLMLALAISTLPFGMGAMMAAQDAPHHPAAGQFRHHDPGSHHGHPADEGSDLHDDSLPDGGSHVHFAACGACLSLPASPGNALALRAALPIPELRDPSPLRSLGTLPALPPPRA